MRARRRQRKFRVGHPRVLVLLTALFAVAAPVLWVVWRDASGQPILPEPVRRVATADGAPAAIVKGAQRQIGDRYDAAYRTIPFPGGDVGPGRGACTDVVIRALRDAGLDLQRLVHEDIDAAPQAYGISRPDPSIDHRRVLNLMVFFRRHGRSLPIDASDGAWPAWAPGDIVCWALSPRQFHIGVISDGVTEAGRPLVIHNCASTREEDALTRWKIIGHFRYPA